MCTNGIFLQVWLQFTGKIRIFAKDNGNGHKRNLFQFYRAQLAFAKDNLNT